MTMAKNRFRSPGVRAAWRFWPAPFVAAALAAGNVAAEAPVIPQYGPDKHEGVSSCDGSTCHGSAAPRNDRNVREDKVLIWSEEDRHSQRAYKVLLNRDSNESRRTWAGRSHPTRTISRLSRGQPAPGQAPDRERRIPGRGRRRLRRLSRRSGALAPPHDSGISHAKNVELGMYPTDEPVAFTRLCLSCHLEDRIKFVDHRLMARAIPPELRVALFSILQPYRWEPDDDYTARGKQAPSDVKLWAIGQAVAVDEVLDAMLDDNRNTLGLFPELVLYDCQACHHGIDKTRRWRPRVDRPRSRRRAPERLELPDADPGAPADRPGEREGARSDLKKLHQGASEGRGIRRRSPGRSARTRPAAAEDGEVARRREGPPGALEERPRRRPRRGVRRLRRLGADAMALRRSSTATTSKS